MHPSMYASIHPSMYASIYLSLLYSRSMWWSRGTSCWKGCSIRSWWGFTSPSRPWTCSISSWTTLMEGRCVLQSLEWNRESYTSHLCVSGWHSKVEMSVCNPTSITFSALLPPPEGEDLSWAQGCVLCSGDGPGTGLSTFPRDCLQV